MPAIDLNADLGEGYGPWQLGDDAAMMDIVTSANIACGGHAGDAATMFAAMQTASAKSVSIGAHPGFEDKQGFGRRLIRLNPAELSQLIASQVGSMQGVAGLAGCTLRYVKPHGALCNWAAVDASVARALATAVKAVFPSLAMLAISGTELEIESRRAGLETFAEVFADRGYQDDGTLVPRSEAGAMLTDPEEAAARLLVFLDTGKMPTVSGGTVELAADSICIHGDSPHAVSMARLLRNRLTEQGFNIKAFAV